MSRTIRVAGLLAGAASLACPLHAADYRSIDGWNNNLAQPGWGSSGAHLRREGSGAHYADGVSAPGGAARPSPRAISNAVSAQPAGMYNDRMLSDFVWQWGQFIDHDMDLTGAMQPAEAFAIPVPAGDPWFDPGHSGTQTIPFNRSVYDPATGSGPGSPRQQINQITSWIDGSMVYGSDATRASWLRTGSGGALKMSTHASGPLLPFNDGSMPNDGGPGTDLFVAGDTRANEQIGLTSMHTLFAREHNRWAGVLAGANPGWDDETVYQEARRMVGAEIQQITYKEFLPALLGDGAVTPYGGYDPGVDGTISSAFSTAAFRIGHTMLSGTLMRRAADGSPIPEGDIALREAFFNPDELMVAGGIAPVLKGLAMQRMQEVDAHVVDDIRNFLFGPPGSGGLDLASLNIQRGRDHGLADYNTMRADFGLPPVTSFAEITSDVDLQSALQATYGSVDELDAWIGGLAEDHLAGSSMGALFSAVLLDQFTRLRDGDRFWYEFSLSPAELDLIRGIRLADIIRWNTGLTGIQDNVFFVPEPAGAVLFALAGLALLRRRG